MGFKRGNLASPDPAIQPAFRSGLQLSGGQIDEKLNVVDSTVPRLPQQPLQIAGHVGEVQRLEICS
jgi:hypothetical protein